MTLGQRIRAARIKADLGLKEAAKMMGRGITTLSLIEADKPVSERTKTRAEMFLKELARIRKKS